MNTFDHIAATSAGEAVAALAQSPETRIIAGGTDLLTLMKAGLAAPPRLLDLKAARALRYLRFDADGPPRNGSEDPLRGTLHIGALATLADLERNAEVAARLPLLPQSVRHAATP